jgi:hypothetical protein
MSIALGSQQLIELNKLIEENLRAGRDRPPIYVDMGNNLNRILSRQNHVVFGRRGSGKSTLLLSAKDEAEKHGVMCIYFDSELIKKNPYPDVLVSILVKIFGFLLEQLGSKEQGKSHLFQRMLPRKKGRLEKQVNTAIQELEKLKTEPQIYDIAKKTTTTQEKRTGAEAQLGIDRAKFGAKFDKSGSSTLEEAVKTSVEKIGRLQQELEFYHNLLAELLGELNQNMMLFLDDFYFITRQDQPHVIDYLHRLSKATNMFLKLGTIRYRTRLYILTKTGETIGVELDNDILPIDLDYSLENLAAMSTFLDRILCMFAEKVNINMDDLDALFTEGGKKLLHIASGGVPRDFLNLFLRSQNIAIRLNLPKLEKQRVIGEAARHYLQEVKMQNFSEDSIGDSISLENLLDRIRESAIEKKKKTVILVNKEECMKHQEEYDRLKQLMDFRFVHLVDSNTSASYGGRKRYEGYMLDAGLWASPRIPGLEEVDFDKRDTSGRKDELRNCPKFKLA